MQTTLWNSTVFNIGIMNNGLVTWTTAIHTHNIFPYDMTYVITLCSSGGLQVKGGTQRN